MASHASAVAPESHPEIPPDEPIAPVAPFITEHDAPSNLTLPNGASTTTSSISNQELEADSIGTNSSGTGSATRSVRAPSSAPSVRSRIYNFVEEQGRTFHRYR